MEIKTKINDLLSEGKLEEAIDFLMESIEDKDRDTFNTLILLKSRHISNERDNNLNIISRSEYMRSKSQIIYSFLQTMDRIPNHILEKITAENKFKTDETGSYIENKEILDRLMEKKFFLEKEMITTYDSEKKFVLQNQLKEIEVQINNFKKDTEEPLNENSEWNLLIAEKNANVNDFVTFLQKYPNSKYKRSAIEKIKSLDEEEASIYQDNSNQKVLIDSDILDGTIDSDILKYIAVDVKNTGIFAFKPQKIILIIKNQSNEYLLKNLKVEIQGSGDFSIDNDTKFNVIFDLEKMENKTIEFEIYSKIMGYVRLDIKICNEFYSPTVYLYAVKDNPYYYGNPVDKESNFVGREEEIKTIKADIQGQKSSRLIVGEQRTGKTSLLFQVRNVLYKSNIIPIYISLESRPSEKPRPQSSNEQEKEEATETLKWLINQIIFELDLLRSTDSNYDFLPKINTNDFTYNFLYPSDFINNLKKLLVLLKKSRNTLKLCLLFDEGNELLHIEEKLQLVLRNTLVELSKSMTMILACSNEFLEYTQHSKSSPFKNIFSYSLLRPFEGKELDLLIEKPANLFNYNYSQSAKRKIALYTGGHPYYTQAFCAKCFDIVFNTDNKNIEENHVEQVFNQIKDDAEFKDKFLLGYWNLIKLNPKFVDALRKILNNDKIPASLIEAIRSLENRSLIKMQNDSYIVNSLLFKTWLTEVI